MLTSGYFKQTTFFNVSNRLFTHNLTLEQLLTLITSQGLHKALKDCITFILPQELYDNVKKEEFKVPGGEGGLAETFFNPEREGWLTKEGGKYKSKHRRWFILKEGMLYYFKQASVSLTLKAA